MKKFPIKTEYYKDFSDDFEGEALAPVKIDKSYNYSEYKRGFLFGLKKFFLYRLIITPIALFHTFVLKRNRFIGKEKLRKFKDQGYFIYANHTDKVGDAFMPHALLFPKKAATIIDSKNLAVPFIGKCLKYFGGIPRPTELSAMRNFSSEIEKRILDGRAVIIYPEAHLWQYMTKLRPFGSESFTFQERLGAPAFTLTRTYKKHKRAYRCDIYIDGPFYPDKSLSPKEAREKLRIDVREAMERRCSLSDIEIIKYEENNSTARESL